MLSDHLWEIFLVQIILYSGVYYLNAYVGFLLCLVMATISFAIFVLSFIFDRIEKSKVPRSYYWIIFSCTIAPLIVLIGFGMFDPNAFAWLYE